MILKKDYLSNIGIFIMLIPIFQPKIFTQYTITTLIYIVLNIPFVYNLIGYRFESMLSFFTGSGISDSVMSVQVPVMVWYANILLQNPLWSV